MKKADEDLSIDELALDREWLRQPRLYHRWASDCADIRLRLDQAKNDLELVKSAAYFDLVTNPDAHKLAKTTESAIQAKLLLLPKVQEAQDRLNEAKHELALADAVLAALDHRKRALENLVSLRLADYRASPKAFGADKEEVESMEKSIVRRRGIKKSNDG